MTTTPTKTFPSKTEGQAALDGCVAAFTTPLIAAFFIWLGWDVGVAGCVKAAGGHVDSISYWGALFVRFFLGTTSQSIGMWGRMGANES